jgi:ubiquinone/menaquinone biosynthesis C-methylase UbiE
MVYENIQKTVQEYPDGVIEVASNGRIGRYCFFPKKIQKHYGGRFPSKLTVLDVACGAAADHPLLYDFFDKKGIELVLIGIDINEKLLQITKEGLVTYPLEVDLQVDSQGRISIEKNMSSYRYRNKAFFPNSIYDYFTKWKKGHKFTKPLLHIDNIINEESGRWIMNPEYRKRLDLKCEDATQLPFEDNYADVIIAENFLFGCNEGVHKRINDEIDRVLKPNGLYLGDDRFDK